VSQQRHQKRREPAEELQRAASGPLETGPAGWMPWSKPFRQSLKDGLSQLNPVD
ncbi:hypothetical protein ACLOJK_006783, partial [Asimina triloba]